MNEPRTIVAKLDERGVLPLLEMAHEQEWGGVVRVTRGRIAGAVWMVKGQVAHAQLSGTTTLSGVEALEAIIRWNEGEYVLETDVLPPERTIRASTAQLLTEARMHVELEREQFAESQRTAVVGRTLLQVFDGLRERVPGLESLSLLRGPLREVTTSHDAAEMDWMDRQLKSFFAKDHQEPDTLFVQEGEHTLLVLNQGGVATVLSARAGTAPEALFWAAAEAQRRVLQAPETLLSER